MAEGAAGGRWRALCVESRCFLCWKFCRLFALVILFFRFIFPPLFKARGWQRPTIIGDKGMVNYKISSQSQFIRKIRHQLLAFVFRLKLKGVMEKQNSEITITPFYCHNAFFVDVICLYFEQIFFASSFSTLQFFSCVAEMMNLNFFMLVIVRDKSTYNKFTSGKKRRWKLLKKKKKLESFLYFVFGVVSTTKDPRLSAFLKYFFELGSYSNTPSPPLHTVTSF